MRRALAVLLACLAAVGALFDPAAAAPGSQAAPSLVFGRPGNGGFDLLAVALPGGAARRVATLDGVTSAERFSFPFCEAAPPQSVVCWRGRQIVVYDLVAGTNAVVTEATVAADQRPNWRLFPGAEGGVWVREVLPDPQEPDSPKSTFRLGLVTTGPAPAYRLVAAGDHVSLGGGLSVIGDSPARNRVVLKRPAGDIGVPGVRVLDRTTGAEVAQYPPKPPDGQTSRGMGIVPVSVSPDGRWLLTGPEPQAATIWVWDLDNFSPTPANATAPTKQTFSGVLWRADGKALVSLSSQSMMTGQPADNSNTTTLWTFNSADGVFEAGPVLAGQRSPVALGPDGKWLILRSFEPEQLQALDLAAGGDPVKVGEPRDAVLGWLQTQ